MLPKRVLLEVYSGSKAYKTFRGIAMERSNFIFLQELHPELATLAQQAENSIWLNPRGTLTQGRLFGELLAKTISVQEKVEPVFSISQSERLHKMAREGLLSEEIRDKFEWLRRSGNTAAHSSREIHADLALTAHRHMFELASWYVEVYGPVAMELPVYQMPLQQQEPVVQPVEIKPAMDPELVEKVVSDQLEARLLPALDEKFRSIEEALLRMTEVRSAAALNEPEASAPAQTAAARQQPVKEASPSSEDSADKVEIADILQKRGFILVDKRPFGGALWVVGGWELKQALGEWHGQGIYFRFARNGSNSTKRQPAWFLLGKNPSAERWVIPFSEGGKQTARSPASAKMQSEENTPAEAAEVVAEMPVQTQAATEQPVESPIQQETAETGGEPKTDSVSIPQHLRGQTLQGYVSARLADLSASMGATVFGDWNEERLLQLYEQQPKLLHDVMVQLWFFGFQFTGKLGRFLKLQHDPDEPHIGELQEGILLDQLLTPDVCRLLQRFGIIKSHQLSGIPVSSLAWLLRGRHEETVARLEGIKRVEQSAGKDELEEENDPSDKQNLLLFRVNGQELVLPDHFREMRIADLQFQGCNALLRGIQEQWHITAIGELPEALSVLPTKIKGVGTTAVMKFFEQLKDLAVEGTIRSAAVEASPAPDEPVRTAGSIKWQTESFNVSDADMEMSLEEVFVNDKPKFMARLNASGIRTVGQLPSRLEQLLNYPGVRGAAVAKFYDQLCEILNNLRLQREREQTWSRLSLEERMTQAIQETLQSWQLWLAGQDSKRGTVRNLEILKFRWNSQKSGRKATLEETGQQFGLTRERIRQIVLKQHEKLKKDVLQVARALKEAFAAGRGFFYFPMDIKGSFEHDLIVDILDAEGFTYLDAYGWWSKKFRSELETLQRQLRQDLKSLYKGVLVAEHEYRSKIDELSVQYQVPPPLLMRLAEHFITPVLENFVMLSGSTKADMVEVLLRRYPDGVEVYKKADELLQAAETIWPGEFEKEREIYSVLTRDEFSDIAYLWGRGTYIHQSFVTPDIGLIQEISSAVEALLVQRSPISVGHIFEKYEDVLQAARIPNEYALYAMLRKYGSSALQLRKFPHIWHESDGFQLNNAEMIKSYIREINQPVSREQLKEEFVSRRGWKYFTVDFNLASDPDFVRADFGIIGLKEFYPLGESEFQPLFTKLQNLISGSAVVHIGRLFDEMRDYCRSFGIESTYTLYDLLQLEADERFIFARYPLVALAGQEWGDLNLQALTEQYVLEQGTLVPREQLWQWLTEELGARESTLDLVLSNSRSIIYYTRGQYGEYVHRDTIGWTPEKENALVDWANLNLITASANGKPFILAEQLLLQEKLPELLNGLSWSEDLLIDLLKKSDKVRLTGSYDAIILAKEQSQIQTEADFVAYILKSFFNGKALATELYRKLAELRYSKDGKFLYATLKMMEEGNAPFRFEDEYVVLNE